MNGIQQAWKAWGRWVVAGLAVVLLSVPSALGVYRALEPTRGTIAAALAASGIELVYISVALLGLQRRDLLQQALVTSQSAVVTAVLLNVYADYSARVPNAFSSGAQFWGSLDVTLMAIAAIESLPLAGLAYAMAQLLHKAVGVEVQAAHTTPQPKAQPAQGTEPVEVTEPSAVRDLTCKHCGASGLTMAELMTHGRRHKREREQVALAAMMEQQPDGVAKSAD